MVKVYWSLLWGLGFLFAAIFLLAVIFGIAEVVPSIIGALVSIGLMMLSWAGMNEA